MSTHVRAVAVLFLVFGGLCALVGLGASFLLGGLGTAIGLSGGDDAALGGLILGLTGAALTAIILIVAVPSLIAGWGLLKRRRWARILGIVLAAISLVNWWVGTLFGVYALWVLLNKRTEPLFGD